MNNAQMEQAAADRGLVIEDQGYGGHWKVWPLAGNRRWTEIGRTPPDARTVSRQELHALLKQPVLRKGFSPEEQAHNRSLLSPEELEQHRSITTKDRSPEAIEAYLTRLKEAGFDYPVKKAEFEASEVRVQELLDWADTFYFGVAAT